MVPSSSHGRLPSALLAHGQNNRYGTGRIGQGPVAAASWRQQAKRILIAQQHCPPEQSFEMLTRLSRATHRKLRDCAAALVTSTAEDRAR